MLRVANDKLFETAVDAINKSAIANCWLFFFNSLLISTDVFAALSSKGKTSIL